MSAPATQTSGLPLRTTAAHKTSALAELVCSNSFRADDHEHNAVGLLHAASGRNAPRKCIARGRR